MAGGYREQYSDTVAVRVWQDPEILETSIGVEDGKASDRKDRCRGDNIVVVGCRDAGILGVDVLTHGGVLIDLAVSITQGLCPWKG